MPTTTETPRATGGRLPPRPVIRTAWVIHRAIHRASGGRMGLRPASEKTWGMMLLKTIGRKTGHERSAILGYFEDGPNLVTLAMNGWGAPEPAWWLNLQAHPEATVQLSDRTMRVRGRAATPDERPGMWARWRQYDGDELDGWASRRPHEPAVVILEPMKRVE